MFGRETEKKAYGASGRFYLIPACFLALVTEICWHGYVNLRVFPEHPEENIIRLLELVLWTAGFYFLFSVFERWTGSCDSDPDSGFLKLKFDRRSFLQTAGLLFLAFLPYLIINAPGVCNLDTQYQLYDLMDGISLVHDPYPREKAGIGLYFGQEIHAWLNAHHPVFDTLLFGFFYRLGIFLGSPSAGMLIYNIFFTAFCAAAFSYMLVFMEKLGVEYRIRRLGFFYLVLMPFIPMTVICIVKDSVFGLLFVLYLCTYMGLIKNMRYKWDLPLFVILSILLALSKASGAYAVIPANLCLLLFKPLRSGKGKIKRIMFITAASVLPAAILFIILPRIVYPAADIYPGGRQEKYMTTFQQTALTRIRHEESFTPEETGAVSAVLDWDSIEDRFKQNYVVSVKTLYNGNSTDEEFREYLKVWVKKGLEFPLDYLDAWTGLFGGYFAPVEDIEYYNEIPHRSFWEDRLDWEQNRFFANIRGGILELYSVLRKTPPVSIFFQMVLYDWWIPFFVLVDAVRKKKWDNVFCLLPIVFTVMLLPIMPRSYARYIYPQLFTVPLVLGLAFIKENELN